VAWLARRIAHGFLLVVGVSVLSFVLVELAPGDYFAEMRLDPRISEATVRALRARYGLDRPLPERYLRWVASLARGELGYSFAYGQPVGPLLWPRVRNTLLLTGTATGLAWMLPTSSSRWACSSWPCAPAGFPPGAWRRSAMSRCRRGSVFGTSPLTSSCR